MPKRSWTDANNSSVGHQGTSANARRPSSFASNQPNGNLPRPSIDTRTSAFQVPTKNQANNQGNQYSADTSPVAASASGEAQRQLKARESPPNDVQNAVPAITRKVKACAACRKQKIKCIMPNDHPPCTRCVRRKLSCVLNKSLQSLIEDTRQTDILHSDVSHMHSVLTEVCNRVKIAPPPPMQSAGKDSIKEIQAEEASSPSNVDHEGQHDPSPPLSPGDSPLAQAPIDSFRRIAQLASPPLANLKQDQPHERGRLSLENDLISKNIVSIDTAEYLLRRYLSKLDPYIYGLGSVYSDLQTLRQASPALTACICTVTALHEEGQNSDLYESCNHEFRRIISKSLFEKRDTDFLLALTIGSYWLGDIARILSGDAIRRAADLRLQKYYHQLVTPDPQRMTVDAGRKLVCGIRLWYLLYICDQHLAILYNSPSVMREQDTIAGWEAYLAIRQSTDADFESDQRISSQVALLLIMSRIRESFGSDTCEAIPKTSVTQINAFSRQIDLWLSRWGTALRPNKYVGDFPTKGVNLHFHFAKLHLFHHVFRGLKPASTAGSVLPIPGYFQSAALGAVSAALSILDLLLNDSDLRNGLIGVPHYFHTMITFAGHFLLEASTKYGEQLATNQSYVFNLIQNVINLFHNTPCIEQHPIHRMATGLDRKLQDCQSTKSEITPVPMHTNMNPEFTSTRSSTSYWGTDAGSNAQTYSNQPEYIYGGNANYTTLDDGTNLGLTFPAFGEFDYPDMRMNFLL